MSYETKLVVDFDVYEIVIYGSSFEFNYQDFHCRIQTFFGSFGRFYEHLELSLETLIH